MLRQLRSVASSLTVLAALVLACGVADAATIPITWIDYSPLLMNQTIPNGSVYNVPGVGPVVVTYTLAPGITQGRLKSLYH